MRKIFEVSVTLHGDKAKEEEVVVDATVQEKNITLPTDTKLPTKIVTRCRIMAKLEGANCGAATSVKSKSCCGSFVSSQKAANGVRPCELSGVCGLLPVS